MIATKGWTNVEELGPLDRDKVKATFSKAMAGLVLFHPEPNNIDCLPVKMFEYMCYGLPVIAADFPRWRKIVDEHNCAEKIRWMIEHPSEARQMGENGRKAIKKKYNWENEKGKLLSLYKSMEDK